MTRLQPDDISGIVPKLNAYDEELIAKTGCDLRQIACHAVGLEETDVRPQICTLRVGVVPIRWGQGRIEGFCEATAGILGHLGFDAGVTAHSDIAGLAAACGDQADAVFLADDNDFVALNTITRQYVHDAEATGKGFAAGLDLMTGGLSGQKVLVLGCGPVGRSAVSALLNFGARVSVYDVNSSRAREFKGSYSGPASNRLAIETDFHEALSGHSLVLDATNAAGIIHAEDISSQTYIAAPGMPLGLRRDALKKISGRLLHDPLQIGVATMGMALAKQLMHRG